MNRADLYKLMAWLSPSYPVGAFTYSHGLEWLVEERSITDASDLVNWIGFLVQHGSGRNDSILFSATYAATKVQDMPALHRIAALAFSLTASRERALETLSQGDAFARVTKDTWQSSTLKQLHEDGCETVAYPVAVAITACDHGIDVAPAMDAYIHGFVANLVSAGVRLIPLGHTDGQKAMIALKTSVEDASRNALGMTLDDLGSSAFLADIAAMKHETQYTRLFRT
ncbi:MAG: urease accessory protein UreF [Candidatus Phaeomarinobacter sp.]